MGPKIFRIKRYRFYFLSNEENRIHVHVTSQEGEAKFWLETELSIATYFGLSKPKMSEIQQIIEERKDEINEA